MKDWQTLNYSVPISESIKTGNDEDLLIRGVAINETVTRNGVRYTAEELRTGAPSLRNKPILKDHNNSVDSIVGRTTNNITFDEMNKRVPFEGKIMDPTMKDKIRKGLVTSVSIGARVRDLIEEEYDGEKVITAKGIEFLELSLVGVPADPNAGLFMGFENAVHEAFKIKQTEEIILEPEEKPANEGAKNETTIAEEPIQENYNTGETMEEAKDKAFETQLETLNTTIKEKDAEILKLKETRANEILQKAVETEERVKKMLEEFEKKTAEGTKGKVQNEQEQPTVLEGTTVVRSDRGYAYFQEYANTNAKRLVR